MWSRNSPRALRRASGSTSSRLARSMRGSSSSPMVRTLGIDTWRTSASAMEVMNCAVSKASRSMLSSTMKRLEINPSPTATERMMARLTQAYQRSRLNGLRRVASSLPAGPSITSEQGAMSMADSTTGHLQKVIAQSWGNHRVSLVASAEGYCFCPCRGAPADAGSHRTIHDSLVRRGSVGAALCCEEAGTDKACLLLVPASSQHKAAPTKDASDERYLFSALQRSPKGMGNLPQ
ncbi:Uncharacterised protein [Pseudomonas putida]|nr:Uncharacterised protein [Pseudomonas putida]